MSLTSILEWAGCASGLVGACVLSLNHRLSGWGFVAFLVSNAMWIAFGLLTKAPGLVAMQIGFTATSLLGIWNWFGVKNNRLKRRLAGDPLAADRSGWR